MHIRKTVATVKTVENEQSNTQGLGDCNQFVAALFREKPNLVAVTLEFATGAPERAKRYERI